MIIGCVLILHAAYSLQQYRSLVKDLVESSTGVSLDVDETTDTIPSEVVYQIPPIDIYMELCIAFIIIFLSELNRSSTFRRAIITKGGTVSSQSKNQTKPVMAAPYISRDFDIYAGRGRAF